MIFNITSDIKEKYLQQWRDALSEYNAGVVAADSFLTTEPLPNLCRFRTEFNSDWFERQESVGEKESYLCRCWEKDTMLPLGRSLEFCDGFAARCSEVADFIDSEFQVAVG